MNKTYKVIWSKVRNCYVAVSEIAKRNGKSCTSVNCGAKANRSHVALALSLALCVTGGAVFTMPQIAWADGSITVTDAANPPATLSSDSYGWNVTMYWPTDSSITELNITGGQIYNHVFAGYRAYGTVSGHTVTVSRADPAVEVAQLFGGVTPEPSGGANLIDNNHVIVYGGKIHGDVSGGSVISESGGTAINNTVYINAEVSGDDFTVKGSVFGGFSRNGNVTGNSVSLINGKVINVDNLGGDVIGGYVSSGGNAGGPGEGGGNKVSISGGTVTGSVYGGYLAGGTGLVMQNEVTISGGTIGGDVFGGFIQYGYGIASGTARDNTVNLLGTTSISGKVYGSNDNTTGTGNELHIGGKKGSTTTSIWKNGDTNKVDSIVNFNTIALHKIKWSSTLPALAANSFKYADSTALNGNVSLDITGMTFEGTPSGTMTLLQSETDNNFSSLKLKYSTADAAEIPVTGVTVKTGTEQTKTEKGVALTYDETHTVALADSDKKVNYTVGNTYKSATLGSMKWSDGGYQFAATDTIDAGGLTASFGTDFAVDGAKEKTSGTLDLLDLSETTGTIKSAISQDVSVTLDDVAATSALTLSQGRTDTAATDTDRKKVIYTVGAAKVTKATFSTGVAWSDSEHFDATGYTFDSNTAIDASNLEFTFTDPQKVALFNASTMTLIKNATELTAGQTVTGSDHTQEISYNTANGTALTGTLTGTVSTAADALNYAATGMTLDRVDLAGWDSIKDADVVPEGWTLASGATVETDGMSASGLNPGEVKTIISSGTDNYFAGVIVKGANKYADNEAFSESKANVTVSGNRTGGVKASDDNKSIVYHTQKKSADTVSFGKVDFVKDTTLFDGSSVEYNYAAVTAFGTDGFDVSYASPETVAAGDEMTLLKANATLTAIVNEEKTKAYSYTPVEGVTVDASITGKLTYNNGVVTFTPSANQASKLTFGSVDWKDSGALMTRPSNITFSGADVDTAAITFKNIQFLEANKKMTLVSDFGDSVGTITGTKYKVGSGLEGEGKASLTGKDLIFTAETGTQSLTPTEATHETVMAMDAATAIVVAGNEFVDRAVEGLGLASNMAPDGTSTFASVGGGKDRYETGSHVDTRTWNAVVAVGSKKETKKGSFEWGVFGEYGKGNYTLYDNNGGKGDGNSHYAGGGVLAKWTNKHDVYTEASFRMGRMSDNASNMLVDGLGNAYGYDVHANYYGAHVGLGKVFKVKGNRDLDVYGKFFYTKRDGVNFDAGGNHYKLDSVASNLLRVGARYGSNDKKWNWYGGLAYEYEFDGQSKGTVDGIAIRSASIKGSSVRGELGMRMEATKTNPWKADISIYGYGGKHRGFGGSVSVAYMF